MVFQDKWEPWKNHLSAKTQCGVDLSCCSSSDIVVKWLASSLIFRPWFPFLTSPFLLRKKVWCAWKASVRLLGGFVRNGKARWNFASNSRSTPGTSRIFVPSQPLFTWLTIAMLTTSHNPVYFFLIVCFFSCGILFSVLLKPVFSAGVLFLSHCSWILNVIKQCEVKREKINLVLFL